MKHILPLFFLFMVSIGVQAQDFNFDPEQAALDTMMVFEDEWQIVKAKTKFFNNTSDAVIVRWEISQVSGPTEWEIQVCDNNACYGWGNASNIDAGSGLNEPLTINGNGGSSILNPNVRPKGIGGVGVYELNVTSVDDPNTVLATVTYTYTIDYITSTDDFDKTAVKVFPNPTSDFFTLTDNPHVDEIQIYNIVGKQIASTPFVNGTPISVSSFPNGLYLVRMLNDEGEVLKTSRFINR